jgi:LuxR family transcriptional regulator, maltose regulon positive regulatory protein
MVAERDAIGRAPGVSILDLDLVPSKIRRPPIRPGTVRRSLLVEQLEAADSSPIVSVVAPAGFGKTTLLSQWAERNGRSFAWVSVDEADNDPKVLLGYVAAALDAVEPIGERVFQALASPTSSVPGSVVPRLGAAFLSMTSPVVLVLDDVHVLRDRECRSALSVLADHVPPRSRLALAGRAEPPLRVARLRAEGRILEIGPGDLALTRQEASSLLQNVNPTLGGDDVVELHRRTEGWPVGVYLAALYLREGGPLERAAVSFGGDDRLVSQYLESEFLARISRQQRAFLTRTAVLERMCGPLCDAMLEQSGSAGVLADLAGSNLLLMPLDRRQEWFRYHQLFRDMLLAELHRLEPDLMPVLYRRAAAWHERQGTADEALEYLMKAGDADAAARLVGVLAFPAFQHGRVATVDRWFGWLDNHGAIDVHPALPVMAAMLHAMTGKAAEAERWAERAERAAAVASLPDGSPTIEPWLALLRALLCRDGAEQMRADAEIAARSMAAGSSWRPAATMYLGMACLMAGDAERADALFEAHITEARAAGAMVGACVGLAERSLLASSRGAWDLAGHYLAEAQSVARRANLADYPTVGIMHAAAARLALHEADPPRARAELTQAQRLRPNLTYAVPHLAVQARIELARCHLALGEVTAARMLLREVDQILTRRPGLGVFVQQADDLRAELSPAKDSSAPGASALTAAELRLLPMLSTHLSFPEIAREVFLSCSTIKSQAYSIYRKLGASSRSQAVTRSRELGLLEGMIITRTVRTDVGIGA